MNVWHSFPLNCHVSHLSASTILPKIFCCCPVSFWFCGNTRFRSICFVHRGMHGNKQHQSQSVFLFYLFFVFFFVNMESNAHSILLIDFFSIFNFFLLLRLKTIAYIKFSSTKLREHQFYSFRTQRKIAFLSLCMYVSFCCYCLLFLLWFSHASHISARSILNLVLIVFSVIIT